MITSNIEFLKKEIVEYAKEAQHIGLCQHRAGNFSARDKETGYIVMTPSAVNRIELTTRDILVMDIDGNIIENEGNQKASSESMMHLKAYQERSDVMAVVHTHSMYATSFAITRKPIPAIVFEINTLGLKKGYIPVADYGRPGTVDLANSIIEPLKISDAILLEHHGVITVDSTNIYEAFLKAIYVEEVAQLYFNSLVINQGKEPNAFKVEELTAWEYPKNFKV